MQIESHELPELPELPEIPGLDLFPEAIKADLCTELVEFAESAFALGRAGKLTGKTYTPIATNFARRGQSRELLQYGIYTHSNRIECGADVEPLPPPVLRLINILADLDILATIAPGGEKIQTVPDTCVIGRYKEGRSLKSLINKKVQDCLTMIPRRLLQVTGYLTIAIIRDLIDHSLFSASCPAR